MPGVSNTSPVLNLAIINRLDLLREQFGEIWLPPTVIEEFGRTGCAEGSQIVEIESNRAARHLTSGAARRKIAVIAKGDGRVA